MTDIQVPWPNREQIDAHIQANPGSLIAAMEGLHDWQRTITLVSFSNMPGEVSGDILEAVSKLCRSVARQPGCGSARIERSTFNIVRDATADELTQAARSTIASQLWQTLKEAATE